MKIYRHPDALARFSRALFLVALGFVFGHVLGYSRAQNRVPEDGQCLEVAGP